MVAKELKSNSVVLVETPVETPLTDTVIEEDSQPPFDPKESTPEGARPVARPLTAAATTAVIELTDSPVMKCEANQVAESSARRTAGTNALEIQKLKDKLQELEKVISRVQPGSYLWGFWSKAGQ